MLNVTEDKTKKRSIELKITALALLSALGSVLSTPAHALVSLHLGSPHAVEDIALSEIGSVTFLICISLLGIAVAYRYIKAK